MCRDARRAAVEARSAAFERLETVLDKNPEVVRCFEAGHDGDRFVHGRKRKPRFARRRIRSFSAFDERAEAFAL